MSNHSNRSRIKTAASTPTPAQVLAARKSAGHTQTEAAAVIHTTITAWQKWECMDGENKRAMHPAFFELYKIKTAQ
jgi:putative transcriptional regulator